MIPSEGKERHQHLRHCYTFQPEAVRTFHDPRGAPYPKVAVHVRSPYDFDLNHDENKSPGFVVSHLPKRDNLGERPVGLVDTVPRQNWEKCEIARANSKCALVGTRLLLGRQIHRTAQTMFVGNDVMIF
ncbi:MAG: hypothetical protein CM1200mP18_08170 [Gammaproteobacteria bacterium]|nr:MAG: hypothetical protein CM1200mP18_08170 [Gammaproteobacteria bacterium]